MVIVAGNDAYKSEEEGQGYWQYNWQIELNDLTRNLNLLKKSAQLLGSRLKGKHLFAPGTMFY